MRETTRAYNDLCIDVPDTQELDQKRPIAPLNAKDELLEGILSSVYSVPRLPIPLH